MRDLSLRRIPEPHSAAAVTDQPSPASQDAKPIDHHPEETAAYAALRGLAEQAGCYAFRSHDDGFWVYFVSRGGHTKRFVSIEEAKGWLQRLGAADRVVPQ